MTNKHYLERYNKFLDWCRNQNPDFKFEYAHYHHIKPKCMGGTNEKSNLIWLTPEQHFIAHWMLAKAYPNHRIWFAIVRMKKYIGNVLNPKLFHLAVCHNTPKCPEELKKKLSILRRKLTENQVLEIVHLAKTTELSRNDLASMFNVNEQTIEAILHGRTWTWLTGFDKNNNLKKKEYKVTNRTKEKLLKSNGVTKDKVLQCVELLKLHLPLEEIVEKTGLEKKSITSIYNGISYNEWSGVTKKTCRDFFNMKNKKLTKEEVLSIVEKYKSGKYTFYELGYEFNVHFVTISSVMNGYNYTDITRFKPTKKKYVPKNKVLNEEKVLEIVELSKNGMEQKEIAIKFDIAPVTVSKIITGKTYSEITGIYWKKKI